MGRVEIITRRERRRRWPDEEKLRILEEALAPGVSAAEVARRHDLYPQQLYAWRKALGGAARATLDPAPAFLPVELQDIEAPSPRRRSPCRKPVEIALTNGRVLRVPAEVEAEALRRLVRVLEEA